LTDTASVVVRNRPPVASFTYAPSAPVAGDEITLTSISADPDGPLTSQSWELDGDTAFDDASGPMTDVSFPVAGQYPVSLRVTDRDGAATVTTATLTVQPRPAEPISPFPVVSMLAVVGEQGTRVRELLVKAPVGARVRVACLGRGCPFTSFVEKADVQARASRLIRIRRFARHLLRPGTMIEIRVTKRGRIGKLTRFVIRKGRPPRRVDRCLAPGSKRAVRCPSG
jgi:hypothetical protein